ncbi:MAG: thioredoxin family protein [Rhodobacteraceae bacterium]|nr:thioredoxin family protein [Paracoccaceae bacterium]
MRRRTFFTSALAALMAGPALAGVGAKYSRGLVDQKLAEGDVVFVDFNTDWCVTCRSQARTIQKLVDENPAYMANITFVDVDYDRYGNSSLANRLAIPRRSTLVVLKGDQELGRIVAGTRRDDIKELLDIALAAATTS